MDYEVRWSILKLADILLRAVNEEPPKLSLLPAPATLSTESAPVLPKVSINSPRRPSIVSASESPISRPQSPSIFACSTPAAKDQAYHQRVSTPRERSPSRPASPMPQTPSAPTPSICLAPRRPATPLQHTLRPRPQLQPEPQPPSSKPMTSRPRGRPPKSSTPTGLAVGRQTENPGSTRSRVVAWVYEMSRLRRMR